MKYKIVVITKGDKNFMKTKIQNIILIIFLFSYTTFAVVKNVVVMIGDGMGLAVIDFSRIVLVGKDGKLSFEKFPVVALVRTHSYNSLVTDSAAAATALSCGIKTNNGYLGLSPEGKKVTHIVELAKKNGKSTGLVTTVSISHATPAGFSAHSSSREELPIAEQYVELKGMVDIFLGGGIEYFIPASQEGSKRKDERNLLEEFRSLGYTVFTSKEELLTLPVVKIDKLVGVFRHMDTTYFIDRKFVGRENLPTLAEMSKVALQILLKNKNGFFLMIEGGKIDWACHSNDIATAVAEISEFNDAVETVVEILKNEPDSLIIVTADHETGGLSLSSGEYRFFPEKVGQQKISAAQIAKLLKDKTKEEIKTKFFEFTGINDLTDEEIEKIARGNALDIGRIISSRIEVGWSTKTHSGCSVPLYAIGKDAEVFSDVYDNTEVARKIVQIMNLK